MHLKLSPTIHQLQHFLAIVEHGSLHAAAKALRLSQPAVSKSLRALEETLGVALLQRGARGTTFTPFGEALYARAVLVENELERVRQELNHMAGAAYGKVALGTSATASLLLIPAAIQSFRKRHAKVQINLVGGITSVLLPRLMDGSLDFVVGPRPAQPLSNQVGAWELIKVPAGIAVRRDHPLAKAKSLREFADAEWILSSSANHTTSSLNSAFSKLGLRGPKMVVNADSLLAAYSLLAASEFVGLLPWYTPDNGILVDAISFVNVPELQSMDSIELFFRNDVPLSLAARELANAIRQHARQSAGTTLLGQPWRPPAAPDAPVTLRAPGVVTQALANSSRRNVSERADKGRDNATRNAGHRSDGKSHGRPPRSRRP